MFHPPHVVVTKKCNGQVYDKTPEEADSKTLFAHHDCNFEATKCCLHFNCGTLFDKNVHIF